MQIKATLPLDQLRRKLCERVNEIRAEQLAQPFIFEGVVYDSDERSIANLTATITAMNAGIPLPEGFVWRSADNLDIPHDAASLNRLAAALVSYRSAVYAKSFALKNAIEASDNPASVDIRTCWPNNFAE